MKKSLSLVFALLLLTACTNENTKTENTKGSSTTVTSTVKESSNNSINEKTYCPLTQQLLQLLTENHPKLKKNNHILRIQLVCLLLLVAGVFRKVVISFH